jgi:hypothetical protein
MNHPPDKKTATLTITQSGPPPYSLHRHQPPPHHEAEAGATSPAQKGELVT